MAPKLSGIYRIVSVLEGDALVGVDENDTDPETVRLGGKVTVWGVSQYGENENNYGLNINKYPSTGILDDKVIISFNPMVYKLWTVTYREEQEAYTIQPDSDNAKAWTTPEADDKSQAIKVKELVVDTSEPSKFSTTQLFKFIFLV